MGYSEREKSEFKRLLKRSVLFLLVFFLIDFSFGYVAKKIFFSQETGKYARLTHSIQKVSSEILIMGSSHANRHYVPDILEKELNMTSYNAGVQGQQIIFHTALQRMILKRHNPKLIILNIDESWMYESPESYERLADLYPYYWDYKTELEPILSLNSDFINFKLLFRSFQTNSTIVHAVKYFFQPQKDFKGYRPLHQQMKKPLSEVKNTNNSKTEKEKVIDRSFVNMFEEFIKNAEAHDVNLIFTLSPHLYNDNRLKSDKSLKLMKSIAFEHDIPLIDFSDDRTFIEQYHLFNDPNHLNNDGAIIFTELLTDSLKVKKELLE